ncbi:thiamine biosynthesis protein ThiF [Chondromyces crocatus]|uniref:Thiamine biosynthesis protein ThiF n=1 Tax=Chondromyces crocatus TaxID=52 RepID=A0A0K1EF07_CHOCO|nr:thiamine biosynthesis protein ThiF [Chondromyces crocatus]AKT39148.1 thiamine biosynthesis protein ThiF [Chondromyces crocatus]
MIDPRYLRQALLPEVGSEGQALLASATAAILEPGAGSAEDRLTHEVAERYARGAGFGALTPGAIDRDALAPPELVTSPEAAAVLAGARAALAAVRAALFASARVADHSHPAPEEGA